VEVDSVGTVRTVEVAPAGSDLAGTPRRVLVVTNMYPVPDRPALGIFVQEQVESLRAQGLEVDVLFVDGPANKLNYLWGIFRFRRQIARLRYDLVHAHYVFSGIIALAQRGLPVVTTFHSGEVLEGSFQRTLSRLVSARAELNIAVSTEVMQRLRGRCCVIPCGVDLKRFRPVDIDEARSRLNLPADRKLVLFAAAMRPEKRFDLVQEAFALLQRRLPDAQLVVVSNQPPEMVPLYMNACDVLVLASRKEGSPQVVKEAMACNLPIVSTAVGDVAEVIAGTEGCYICTADPQDIADKLAVALTFGRRTDGRKGVEDLSLERVAQRIVEAYGEVLTRRGVSRRRTG
jgi:teichuronic acid biosynthesis glycosyltransferase TuaC